MKPQPKLRRAFSVIEVLVVIAIIATALALLGPKLVATAEAARRTQCRNNLSQVVLSLHNYEDVHRVLPPGTVNPSGPIVNMPEGYHASWTIQLLPYLEQRSLYQTIDPLFGVYDISGSTPQMPVYFCPSSLGPIGLGTTTTTTRPGLYGIPSAYAACYGDTETAIDRSNNGVFFLNSSINHSQIRDGTANTIFVGEKNTSPGDLGWLSGTSSTLRNTDSPINNSEDLLMDVGSVRNGGFGSGHKDGAMFGFGDGSVKLLRDSVDPDLFRKLGNRHDGQLINKNF